MATQALSSAVLVATLLAVQVAFAGEVVDRIVAVVNGEIITLFELNERLKPVLERFKGHKLSDKEKEAIGKVREDLLEKMVEDVLLQQEVTRMGVTVTDGEVQNELDSIRTRSSLTPEAFEEQLKLEGLTVDDMKKRIRDDILKHRLLGFMVKRKVVVSDEEIKAYYDANAARYVQDKSVDLSVILTPSVPSAEEIRARIEKGEVLFEDAARLYSEGPGASQGGGLGELVWGDMAEAWRDALTDVAPGGMSTVFEFRGFGALLKLNKVLGGAQQPFEEVKKDIRNTLYQRQVEERFTDYMQELRANAVVDIKL